MKRQIALLMIILVVVFGAIYLLVPNVISINQNVIIAASRDGLSRKLFDETKWAQWWPGAVHNTPDSPQQLEYNSCSFSENKKTIGSVFLNVATKNLSSNTCLSVISKNFDTTQLVWTAAIPTSYNPYKRLQIYFEARKIGRQMGDILDKMQAFFSKTENVYDYSIREDVVVDSFLVSTSAVSATYPSVDFVYDLVDRLKKRITDQGAKEAGFPMLNVSTVDSISYLTKVAIPVDRIIPGTDEIGFKRMPAGGNILVVDVKGGPSSIKQVFRQVENYITDYHRSAPAIPFFSLVTDRRQQPDTSKWLTRIYYPVM